MNLDGDVVVANRQGSVTKIAGKDERCVDKDDDGEIKTSTGPDDILPWGEDECVLWHHKILDTSGGEGGPRAIAWNAAGNSSPEGTGVTNSDLWIGWRVPDTNKVSIRKIKGDDGTADEANDVIIDDWLGVWRTDGTAGLGAYGGVVDKTGSFWVLASSGILARVDSKSHKVIRFTDPWDNPIDNYLEAPVPYGIAMDTHSNPWMSSYTGELISFNTGTQTFTNHGVISPEIPTLRGIAVDSANDAWIAGHTTGDQEGQCGLIRFDTVSETVTDSFIELPGCSEPVGVSIDAAHNIWVVDRGANKAYRLKHDDYKDIKIVEGLVSPYTYSDMTGMGLSNVQVDVF